MAYPRLRRIWTLISLRHNAALRRFRYDFSRELAAFVSAAVLVMLFAHIFHDFLTAKIADFPAAFLIRLKAAVAFLILITLATLLRRTMRQERGPEGLVAGTRRRGEERFVLVFYQILFCMSASGVTFALWWGYTRWIGLELTPLTLSAAIALVLGIGFGPTAPAGEKRLRWHAVTPDFTSRVRALLRWRLIQIAARAPATRRTLMVGVLGFVSLPFFARAAAPFALLASLAMAAGLFFAAALCLQLAQDVRQAWAEQAMGVTHDEIVGVYRRLAWASIALTIPVTLATGWFVDGWQGSLTLAALGATAPALTPSLMFQLDARRPFLQILTIILATLFLGTTILMHPLGVILLALVIKTAGTYQRDLYYRAKA